jgi:predicted ATP-grasp superfamily ATP-dependent carboligase
MPVVLLASTSSFFDSIAEIPFVFKKAGCQVDVFCPAESWLRSNQFHDKWIEAAEDEESFAAQLINLIENNFDTYFQVYLLDDFTIKLMNEKILSEELFKKIMPVNSIKNKKLLSSKIGLSILCQKYNIISPKFINYSDLSNIHTAKEILRFPILLKEDFSFSGLGIQYCEDENALMNCLHKVSNINNLVLQEFIKGDDIGVEALFYNGELIMYNAAEILTYMHNKFSFTTRRNYFQNKEIEQLLKVIGKSFGLNSFASIQYIYKPETKTYYLVEVDCRTNMWVPYSRFLQQNFIEGLKQIFEGKKVDSIIDYNKKTEITIFDRDIRRCIKYRDYKGFMQWLTNYHGYWKFVPLYDKKYFFRMLRKLWNDFSVKFFPFLK